MSFTTQRISADILGDDSSIHMIKDDRSGTVMVHRFKVTYEDCTSKAEAEVVLKERTIALLEEAIAYLRG
jgi:hypothetical protein